MALYKEIVTKAVIGKGKKHYKNTYTITTDNTPNTVLGCWIINHKFDGANENDRIVINGSFDVNLWYSYNNDTKTAVITKTINYKEYVNVSVREKPDTDIKDIIVRSLKQPTVSKVDINNGEVNLKIEKELGVEIVGNTKVKVSVEEFDDDYEELIDDELDDTIENIDAEYLDKDVN